MDKALAITHAYDHLNDSMRAKQGVINQQLENIYLASELLVQCFRTGNKVLLCGNGGSAADCQHMATEFVSGLSLDCGRLPAIALTTDTSFITAHSNDVDFRYIFSHPIETLGDVGDVLICISTHGRSPNVAMATEHALGLSMKVIALTGGDGGVLSQIVSGDKNSVCITVPHNNTQIIQECHLAIEHILVELVEREMFGSTN
mgnify:CR=1 FL=1